MFLKLRGRIKYTSEIHAILDYVRGQTRGVTSGFSLRSGIVLSRNPSNVFRGANEGTPLRTPTLGRGATRGQPLFVLLVAGLSKCKLIETTFIN